MQRIPFDFFIHVCNFADDTTLNACDMELPNILSELEDNALTAILWFDNNYMKLNQSKCHFLTSGSTEHLWVRVGNEVMWESQYEKLLGMTVDKNLNFNLHLKTLCSKVQGSQFLKSLEKYTLFHPFLEKSGKVWKSLESRTLGVFLSGKVWILSCP